MVGADVSVLEKAWDPDSEEESTSQLACSGVSGREEGAQRGCSMNWKNFKLDSAAATRRNFQGGSEEIWLG